MSSDFSSFQVLSCPLDIEDRIMLHHWISSYSNEGPWKPAYLQLDFEVTFATILRVLPIRSATATPSTNASDAQSFSWGVFSPFGLRWSRTSYSQAAFDIWKFPTANTSRLILCISFQHRYKEGLWISCKYTSSQSGCGSCRNCFPWPAVQIGSFASSPICTQMSPASDVR